MSVLFAASFCCPQVPKTSVIASLCFQGQGFKAALINIVLYQQLFELLCNMKGVAHSDELTENYRPTLQFTSSLHSFFGLF